MLKKERMMKPTSFSSTPNARYANGRPKGWRETGHSPYLSASGRHQRAPATNPGLQATHTDSAFRLQSSYDPSISRQHSTFGHVRRPAQTHSLSKSRFPTRSEEHTSELQSRLHLVCRLLLEKKKMQVLVGLIALLNIERATLVGASSDGAVAAPLALRAPVRVQNLALAGAAITDDVIRHLFT